jgi:hypothetical protein
MIKLLKKYYIHGILLFLVISAGKFLYRDLWFDEALTVLNFATLPNIESIYQNYVIPNNHILYTCLLHYYLKFAPNFIDLDFYLRLPSLLCGIFSLGLLWKYFKDQCGRENLFTICICLSLAVAFLIYATAIRGYMLSTLAATASLIAAIKYAKNNTIKNGFIYLITSIITVGIIPGNLATLGANAIFAARFIKNNPLKKIAFYILGIIPVIGFLIFYLPIWDKLIKCSQLGEGWHNRSQVLIVLLIGLLSCGFITSFIYLYKDLVKAVIKRKYFNLFTSIIIILIPIVMVIAFKVAPFPRVFIPFIPLMVIISSIGLKNLKAILRKNKINYKYIGVILFVATFILNSQYCRNYFCEISGGPKVDDFFNCYYIQSNHKVNESVRTIQKLKDQEEIKGIYLSFNSDPWPFMYYANINNLGCQNYLFDGPRGRVEKLESQYLVVIEKTEDPKLLENRFNTTLILKAETSKHLIFEAK